MRAFDTGSKTIKVKQGDGSEKEQVVATRGSVFGPVFTRADGTVVALRAAGLDRPFGMQEYWDLDNAQGLGEFVAALKQLQMPMFNHYLCGPRGAHPVPVQRDGAGAVAGGLRVLVGAGPG